MTVSLDDFRYRDTAEMPVIPPGAMAPIATITFAGPGHEKARGQANRLHELNRHRSNGRFVDRRSLDALERENCLWIAERIVTWSGISRRGDDGQVTEIPFNHDAAMEMLGNPALGWLFVQCLAFISTDASFLPQLGAAKPGDVA